jgi:hypothetical protein
VHADQIDLDRWAAALVDVQLRHRRERSSIVTRHAFWLIAVLWLALAVLIKDLWFLVPAGLTLAAAIGAWVWNRRLAGRIATELRALPAASEPFTFLATGRGTSSTAPSGSDELSWSRYRGAALLDDLVALELDDGTLRLLPVVSLAADVPASEAVTTMTTWIEAATSRQRGMDDG